MEIDIFLLRRHMFSLDPDEIIYLIITNFHPLLSFFDK